MITLMLALAAPAQLSSAEAIGAMRCAAAVAVVGPQDTHDEAIQLGAELTFHLMRAAHAERGGQAFLERVQALQNSVLEYRPETGAAPTLAAECRKRFPMARTQVPAKLPSDPFPRDVLCLTTLSLVVGLGQSAQEQWDDATYVDRYQPVLERFGARLDDEALKKRGFADSEAFTILAGDQLEASIAVGNPISVATSCEVISNQF